MESDEKLDLKTGQPFDAIVLPVLASCTRPHREAPSGEVLKYARPLCTKTTPRQTGTRREDGRIRQDTVPHGPPDVFLNRLVHVCPSIFA